uniref:INTS8 TPR repeats domain-containing protein n=1 Tax=Globisporangium ultimum (strain ATCC 200006 / CBS 805.95 / DAOM BR144) TaxID=431595 RepID=K3WYF7_GLOUD
MPLMPGSPRPAPREEDDGVYRSIFQQPLIEIPPAAPSYAWFEFLLHPDALQRHLATLRKQNAAGAHSATSAIELVREFLDQAQLVADEGNIRNNRYKALQLVAAQVALQMKLTLSAIEKALPLHFQRLLLDGIVDFAESREPRNEFTKDITLEPYEAHLLHNRWTLRAMVSQSQNGYLTSSTRNEADEIMTGFQTALADLMPSHIQIAQNIQATLVDEDRRKLSKQTQLDAFYDLGVYFFSFNGYEKAYECFSRASELMEDFSDAVALTEEEKESLEAYLAACEAVLESRSMIGGDTTSKSPKAQLELAWETKDWDKVAELLQADMVAYELTRFPPGYRHALEQGALRLLRLQNGALGRDEVALAKLRRVYKRIALGNAIFQLVQAGDQDHLISVETCVCCIFRLLQEEIYQSSAQLQGSKVVTNGQSSANLFNDLAEFVLHMVGFLYPSVAKRQQTRLQQLLVRLGSNFKTIPSINGAKELLARCDLSEADFGFAQPVGNIADPLSMEAHLQASVARQRMHFRLASDLNGLFAFERTSDRDAFIGLLRNEFSSLSDETSSLAALDEDDKRGKWKNLITFCMLHSCWDALTHWKSIAKKKSLLHRQLEFAVACGALMQYLSSLEGTHESGKAEFSIVASNKLVADILLKRKQVLDAVASDHEALDEDAEALQLLIDLPLWLLETLTCISAGLLQRAYMRNICDYRISFELTPYGDLAFLQAFATETPKKKSTEEETKESVDSSAGGNFMTAPFIKSFQADLVALHSNGLNCLLTRCSREPRWHCAKADLSLNPIVKQKLSSTSDPHAALKGYLVAASLATNFFSDMTSVVDIIDQSSLVRLSQCLVKVGAHVAAAVLYQCFAPEEFKYGLRILQLAPESHDEAFFQYFWELPFLELLVHLHSQPKHYNSSHVTLLTHLIQSPELNSSNPSPVLKDVEQRILRCYFRELCRVHLR